MSREAFEEWAESDLVKAYAGLRTHKKWAWKGWQACAAHYEARIAELERERDWAYGAFKRLVINVCEMDSDNKNGDFELNKLARLDLDACVECCADLPEAFQNWTGAPAVTRRDLIAERDRLRDIIYKKARHDPDCMGGCWKCVALKESE